jgi:hypothetical protein
MRVVNWSICVQEVTSEEHAILHNSVITGLSIIAKVAVYKLLHQSFTLTAVTQTYMINYER